MSVLYRITSPSGKSYIGVGKYSAEVRFKKHSHDAKSGRKTALCNAIRHYGAEAMRVETLVISTSEYCFDLEVKAIAAFGTLCPNGYNMTTGGEGIHEMDPETTRRHRDAIRTPEHRAFASASSKIHRNTEKARAKTSADMKSRWQDPQWVATFSEKMKAKWLDPSYRAALSLKVPKTCCLCGCGFTCTIRQASIAKFCSASCKAKWHRTQKQQETQAV